MKQPLGIRAMQITSISSIRAAQKIDQGGLPRQVEVTGIRNRMRGSSLAPRDYVILPKMGWAAAPKSLVFNGRTYPVISQNYNFVARGLSFPDDQKTVSATLFLGNKGIKVPLLIKLQTAY